MWKDPEVYQDKSDKKEWRWRVKAKNGEITAASTEGYKNKKDAEKNLLDLAEYGASALLGMRPSVVQFAISMERELRNNDKEKGTDGWLSANLGHLLAKLVEEVGEVGIILQASHFPKDDLKKECADVGNIAMMITDRVSGL